MIIVITLLVYRDNCAIIISLRIRKKKEEFVWIWIILLAQNRFGAKLQIT